MEKSGEKVNTVPETILDMRSRAVLEMEKYITALGDSVDSRMISLADGELAAYAKMGLLSIEDAGRYLERLNEFRGRLYRS